MRYLLCLLILITFSCKNHNTSKDILFLEKGDYWINCYEKLHINTATIAFREDKIYCSTHNDFGTNVFYCLDIKTGRVYWANQVINWAAYSPIVLNDIIYYVDYLGDRYGFDLTGNQIWYQRNDASQLNYSPTISTYNPINHNLIVGDVIDSFHEFDRKTGNVYRNTIDSIEDKTTVLPAYNGKYIYLVLKGDSANKKHNIDKFWPLLVCRNYKTGEVLWQKFNFNCGNLYLKEGSIYAIGLNKVYSINSISGAFNWSIDSNKVHLLKSNFSLEYAYDRMLLRPNGTGIDSTYTALDYKTDNTLPYKLKSDVYIYMIRDNTKQRNLYKIKITVGSFRSNNHFNDAAEVYVKKFL